MSLSKSYWQRYIKPFSPFTRLPGVQRIACRVVIPSALVSHGHVNNSDLLMWINVSTLDWYAFAKLTLLKA